MDFVSKDIAARLVRGRVDPRNRSGRVVGSVGDLEMRFVDALSIRERETDSLLELEIVR